MPDNARVDGPWIFGFMGDPICCRRRPFMQSFHAELNWLRTTRRSIDWSERSCSWGGLEPGPGFAVTDDEPRQSCSDLQGVLDGERDALLRIPFGHRLNRPSAGKYVELTWGRRGSHPGSTRFRFGRGGSWRCA
jgi:hypothetical protein